ncbi:MAG: hypothetical protein AAGB29_05905, partial [Planctomycetota bacterium]
MLVVVVLMLAGVQAVRTHEDLTVIAVVDESESVRRFVNPAALDPENQPATTRDWVRSYLREASADRRQDDRFAVVTYDNRPTVRAL